MSKLDAAVYEIVSGSLSRINEQIHKLYSDAENGSVVEKIWSDMEDIIGTEIENLENLSEAAESLADDTDED